jgi:NADH dehydrogenase
MDVVTGAFSYTGRAIAEELLRRGRKVRTLTRRDARDDPLEGRIEQASLQFRDRGALLRALDGVDTIYNTYWVRFERGETTFERAVANTRVVFGAAQDAGVKRVVHVSVSNPTIDSPLPYFRGKAQVESEIADSGVSHAIVRPTLVFGANDILLNNIAWALRRSPVFPIAGDGGYRVQPVSIEDVATICVDAGECADDVVLDAAGPETLTYRELVRAVADAVGSRSRIVPCPRGVVLAAARVMGAACRDVVLTSDELAGLEASLLVSQEPPLGTASFGAWVVANGDSLGRGYVSELARNFRTYDPL